MFATAQSWETFSQKLFTELDYVIAIIIVLISTILVIFSQYQQSLGLRRSSYFDETKGIYAKRFRHFRIPSDLFTASAASSKNSKDKIVRQAKKLLRYVLPAVNTQSVVDFSKWEINLSSLESLDVNCTPLLCFVNCKSGGQQGELVLEILQKFISPNQVFDLSRVNPADVLRKFITIPSLRVLVAGGDGSAGWLLKCFEEFPPDRRPPLAILPLGTGNDLARVLGWGHSVECNELVAFLDHIRFATIAALDRWEIVIERDPGSGKGKTGGAGEASKTLAFNNYFGIGVDASIAHSFHEARNNEPHKFSSQFVNKIWYGLFGGKEILAPSNKNLTEYISVIADGQEINFDEEIEGIILSNIPSYGGGARLWTNGADDDVDDEDESTNLFSDGGDDLLSPLSVDDDSQSDYLKSPSLPKIWKTESIQDGLLEVVSVQGSFHLAQIQLGMTGATRLKQAREVVIKIKKNNYFSKIPVQVDGEPWFESTGCTIRITRGESAQLLQYHSEGSRYASIATEVIEWGHRNQILNSKQRKLMLMECSRRLELRAKLEQDQELRDESI